MNICAIIIITVMEVAIRDTVITSKYPIPKELCIEQAEIIKEDNPDSTVFPYWGDPEKESEL